MDNKEKEPEWEINYKRIAIIAIVLVSIHLWGMFGGYQWISEISPIYNEMPVGMANPLTSNQCKELVGDLTNFRNFLGVGDLLTEQELDEISYSDYIYLTELELEIQKLKCTLKSDT